MRTAGKQQHYIELTREYPRGCHVSFDSETAALEGQYTDEISSHRAKKVWTEVLETQFLLDAGHDFTVEKVGDLESASYVVRCTFTTACGRYAFWRLTNCQAPEAQYTIETAHIPNAESLYEQILRAPDLEEKRGLSVYQIDEELPPPATMSSSVVHWVRRLLGRT